LVNRLIRLDEKIDASYLEIKEVLVARKQIIVLAKMTNYSRNLLIKLKFHLPFVCKRISLSGFDG